MQMNKGQNGCRLYKSYRKYALCVCSASVLSLALLLFFSLLVVPFLPFLVPSVLCFSLLRRVIFANEFFPVVSEQVRASNQQDEFLCDSNLSRNTRLIGGKVPFRNSLK
jgi:hypothetical protein